MQPTRIMNGSAMVIAGLAERYTGETRRDIPALWARFGPRIPEAKNMIGKSAYGVVETIMNAAGEFTYLAGVEIAAADNLLAEFTAIEIPARRYAVFTHNRHVSEIPTTTMKIFDEWLPGSGYRVDSQPGLIERYGEAFDPETGLGDMEVWIPVTK